LLNVRALEAQFSGATAMQVQAMVNYQKVILNAYVDVVNGMSGVQRAHERLQLKKEQKDALVRAIATADALFRAGKASYLEVLIVHQSSLRADLELIETHQRGQLALVAIYKALGGGWR
jgi:outer membrane protein TolC